MAGEELVVKVAAEVVVTGVQLVAVYAEGGAPTLAVGGEEVVVVVQESWSHPGTATLVRFK